MPKNMKNFPALLVSLENDEQCTIISIVPFMINEFKPGIYPGRFIIQPCLDTKKPETLLVGTSVHFIPQYNGDDEMPPHVVKTSCKDIAKAVVSDYLQGQMDVDEFCGPGIAWLPGKVIGSELLTKHPNLYMKLVKMQSAWFEKLVQRADNDWNRYKRHTVISENQRFACRALGLERDWLTPNSSEIPVKCPACFSQCSSQAVVCMNCRCILDKEKYDKMTFAA